MVERLSGKQAAALIQDRHRTLPVLVLTIPAGAARPLFNGPGIEREIGDAGTVVEIEDSQTWDLARELDGGRVFGGAARIFPADGSWRHGGDSLRRLAKDRAEARRHEASLIALMRGEDAPAWTTSTEHADSGLLTELATQRRTAMEKGREAADLRARVSSMNRQLSQQQQQIEELSQRPERLFADDEQQLRHEVYLAWAEAIPAEAKGQYPLRGYDVGPDLLASLDALGSKIRQKALRRIVMLLTGADVRDVHAMTRAGGEPVTREDGAVLMRAYVEQNTAAARRIHYWRQDGGRIELSRVVLHDDFSA